ncbi:MAG: di-heme oxidoredictase family protein, partial [Dehalococcoidales bacterium]
MRHSRITASARLRRWLMWPGAALLAVALSGIPSATTPAEAVDPELLAFLFPDDPVTLPAVPPWGFPEFTGIAALEPLPDSFDIVERPAWFDGIPATIRPFPRPSVGDGGPDDNHADMWVFFYPDGTPVPQLPLLEVVPLNAAGPDASVPDIAARLFSPNWEIHVVRVAEDYAPGSIGSILNLDNPRLVLENLQTNIFVTFPILPQSFTIPDLELNNLMVEQAIFEGNVVSFVEYDVGSFEFSEKPLYLFRKPSGEFSGAAVLSTLPGMPNASALWEVLIVEVPADYLADTLRSEEAVLASGFPIRGAFGVFAPVESVDGMRTVFPDFMDVISGAGGRFRQDIFPLTVATPHQPFDDDPRISQATLGFTSTFTINEVEIPRLIAGLARDDVDSLLLEALGGDQVGGDILLPPHIARQMLIQDSNAQLVHLKQTDLDTMALNEIVARGQALFEREIFEEDGAGPAFNAYSCATCHGTPFNIGVEPTAGGPGTRFRNALHPTDVGVRTSRNAPHLFGSGILTQLGRERGADGSDGNAFPHDWKGTVATVRDFTLDALQGEQGLQAVERVAELAGVSLEEAALLDPDNDGRVAETTVGDVTALTAFQASLPRPVQVNPADPSVVHGRSLFSEVGCARCHTPVQTLQSTTLELTNPETAGVVHVPLGDPEVEVFTDLKRHSMGPSLADPGPQSGMAADKFRTPPLWGVGSSAPYLHDGSAATIEEA